MKNVKIWRMGKYRLWSVATWDVPGSTLRRLSSSRDRLSLLNISVAPVKSSLLLSCNNFHIFRQANKYDHILNFKINRQADLNGTLSVFAGN